MIDDFDDFCTWVFTMVDDIWQDIAPLFHRPGPAPACSDSELLAMTLIGECRGWHLETEMLSCWHQHRGLFPCIPSQSRFNRRRRQLMQACNLLRQVLLRSLDLAQGHCCVIDSVPVPVMQFYLVPGSTADWAAYGATFGKVSTKKQTIFGYKLHVLVTLEGVILDFALAPANVSDLEVGVELLAEHHDLEVIGDKAYISAEQAASLWRENGIRLYTLPRRNQKQRPSEATKHALNSLRQIIETVNSQLSEQLAVGRHHAHTFWGLCARLYSKLTAHTLCIYINRLLENPEPLQIKALAFPN